MLKEIVDEFMQKERTATLYRGNFQTGTRFSFNPNGSMTIRGLHEMPHFIAFTNGKVYLNPEMQEPLPEDQALGLNGLRILDPRVLADAVDEQSEKYEAGTWTAEFDIIKLDINWVPEVLFAYLGYSGTREVVSYALNEREIVHISYHFEDGLITVDFRE